jgi:AAA+ superfamily predicted ATPase
MFEANRELTALLNGALVLPKELSQLVTEEMGSAPDSAIVYEKEIKELSKYLGSLYTDNEDLDGTVIQIAADKRSERQQVVLSAIGEGAAAMFLDFSLLSSMKAEDIKELSDELLVRARLLHEALVIVSDGGDESRPLSIFLKKCLRQLDVVFVLTPEKTEIDLTGDRYRTYRMTLKLPLGLQQQKLWEKELSEVKTAKDVDPKDFAGRYRLYPGAIRQCVRAAESARRAGGRKSISASDLTDAVLLNTTSNLDALSDRMPLTFTWDDLVVDEKQRKIMDTLVSRVKNRSLVDEEWGFKEKVPYGRGCSCILYGPPGTGKTMAAQVMAAEIGMALYRVDLSQLVDKYVGETEKNIGKIFDEAADGNVILFFDEADALFSRRTEVATSNDKHANTEVAYLLQKIEQHDGVTFLATNRFNDFDAAFIRRITYAVHLERPDEERRLQLFEKILPDKVPRDKDLDLKHFADSFDLCGSEIKEILYSAAFIAAMEGKHLGNRHISEAIRYQQEKTGKVLQGADFGRYL